jgi:hypothetical protein
MSAGTGRTLHIFPMQQKWDGDHVEVITLWTGEHLSDGYHRQLNTNGQVTKVDRDKCFTLICEPDFRMRYEDIIVYMDSLVVNLLPTHPAVQGFLNS